MFFAGGLTTMVVILSKEKYRDSFYLFETIDDLSVIGLWHKFWRMIRVEQHSFVDSWINQ
ncbi:hypothetical protein DSCW_45260 [Desulfosarcina widdelii]|uniref:Uncharacterized protein n=1 Tax=Desulfosarcina widdelii TaxID=947919 RepID=A0A5K7ZAC3_9BACT|nr:hypothetical protein DSCW_45260 [Desulfosarcina widdelii]